MTRKKFYLIVVIMWALILLAWVYLAAKFSISGMM